MMVASPISHLNRESYKYAKNNHALFLCGVLKYNSIITNIFIYGGWMKYFLNGVHEFKEAQHSSWII